MPWCVTTCTSQQYINSSLFCETFHSHSLVATLLKSSENWSWVSRSQNHSAFKFMVKQSYQLNLEGKLGNPCPMMHHHLSDNFNLTLWFVHWSAWGVSKENGWVYDKIIHLPVSTDVNHKLGKINKRRECYCTRPCSYNYTVYAGKCLSCKQLKHSDGYAEIMQNE